MKRRDAQRTQQSSRLPRWAAAAEPWASIAGGAALAAAGVARRSVPGALLAAAGGLLVVHGARGRARGNELTRGIRLERAVTVQKSREELFRFWQDVSNLSRFMQHTEVRDLGNGRSHWQMRGPMGVRVEWESQITNTRENEHIAWRSLPNGAVETVGAVEFRHAPGDRGAELHVRMSYRAPGGAAAAALLKLLGREPGQQLAEDLRRFKQLMEAGEIPTVAGQPSGRRSVPGAVLRRLYGEPPSRQPKWRPQAAAR